MARVRVGASARVPFTPVRVGASASARTPSTKGCLGTIVPILLGICLVVAFFVWPLLVFKHTTYTPHCETNLITGRDCSGPPDEHDHITALGWTVEAAWALVLVLAFRAWNRSGKPKPVKPAKVHAQPKAKPGPRDYHLAPPVNPPKP